MAAEDEKTGMFLQKYIVALTTVVLVAGIFILGGFVMDVFKVIGYMFIAVAVTYSAAKVKRH
eukprot:gnl/Chilomastix_caulleri/1395.p2 GENE.gnl/Chilomastix_caulleri/1395~~gnl/Chilomastix_caulleri/1395.p2  ORF type:complete len:62 (+),score=11.15 gnl/Chilomastix_caulleri/1395:16-201(+)